MNAMAHRILPDGRRATIVPADEAGEFMLSAAEGLISILASADLLTHRQTTAASDLARLYGLGGHRTPWRTTGGGSDRPDEAVSAARVELRALIETAPRVCRDSLWVMLAEEGAANLTVALGLWARWGRLWQDGLDAVADRLKMPKE
jgi:hypothetical protein